MTAEVCIVPCWRCVPLPAVEAAVCGFYIGQQMLSDALYALLSGASDAFVQLFLRCNVSVKTGTDVKVSAVGFVR